eukprot:scaffold13412_cov152-Isochrysis_galbana.AAC.4
MGDEWERGRGVTADGTYGGVPPSRRYSARNTHTALSSSTHSDCNVGPPCDAHPQLSTRWDALSPPTSHSTRSVKFAAALVLHDMHLQARRMPANGARVRAAPREKSG